MKIPKNNFIMCYRDGKIGKIHFGYKGNAKELLALAYCLLHKLYSEFIDENDKENLQRLNKELSEFIFDNL